MIVDLTNEAVCQAQSSNRLFGLCDDPPPPGVPAYIDENDGKKWIAVIVNEDEKAVMFTAIDHCIPISRRDGKGSSRCDGMLSFDRTVIFVELKERGGWGNEWVKDGEGQLRKTIEAYEYNDLTEYYKVKKAYIANSEHPKFKSSQQNRMNQFAKDTGYVLRIENRIVL